MIYQERKCTNHLVYSHIEGCAEEASGMFLLGDATGDNVVWF